MAVSEELEFQKRKATLEKRRAKKRHELHNSQDEIEKEMQDTSFEIEELFRVQWRLVR